MNRPEEKYDESGVMKTFKIHSVFIVAWFLIAAPFAAKATGIREGISASAVPAHGVAEEEAGGAGMNSGVNASLTGLIPSRPISALWLMPNALIEAQDRDESKEGERMQQHEERLYDKATRALDQNRWDQAVDYFNQVVELKGRRADGAFYWKAYAQNKLGKHTEALATLAQLNQSFPQSRWINDAKALEVEIHQAVGHPVLPESEGDEDLKLIAINGLLSSNPERAIPLLEKILHGNQPPKVKERALFVLSQSGSPRAREIVAQIARGESNPDLQRKAIQNLGLFGGKESRNLLGQIYASSNDDRIKKSILQSFMVSGERGQLFSLAKEEKNPELRMEAIQQLGVMGAQNELWELYQADSSVAVKEKILKSMFVGGNTEKLSDVARHEKDPKLRRAAIQSLGLMGGQKTGEALVSIYNSDKDPEIRRAAIQGLFLQGNAKALVELARKETDPAMKKYIVNQLSVMGSREATEYLMELINK